MVSAQWDLMRLQRRILNSCCERWFIWFSEVLATAESEYSLQEWRGVYIQQCSEASSCWVAGYQIKAAMWLMGEFWRRMDDAGIDDANSGNIIILTAARAHLNPSSSCYFMMRAWISSFWCWTNTLPATADVGGYMVFRRTHHHLLQQQ